MLGMQSISSGEVAVSGLTRILVVEDDPLIGTATGLVLREDGGFAVELCHSGSEAIEAARRFHPDLILMDASLPDTDGPTLLAALQRQPDLADIPVIFVTGRTGPSDTAQYRALGALGVVAKPYDPFELADLVRQLWETRYG